MRKKDIIGSRGKITVETIYDDVEAEELVEVKSGGSLEGDVLSQRFALEDGAWFRGRCSPTSPKRFGQKAEQTELYDTEESEEELDSFSSSDKWTIGS